MTQLSAIIVIGTAATVLACILGLLRVKIQGHRPFVALIRRWIAASARTSGLALGLLAMIAISCFAIIGQFKESELQNAHKTSVGTTALSGQGATSGSDDGSVNAEALEALRTYVDTIAPKRKLSAAPPFVSEPAQLADVDTMIARLAARLENQPEDIKGWKLLGWSYLNVDRPEEAASAYEKALKLEPSDVEIKKALTQARSAHNAASRTLQSVP
jgi:tetratricopeptide (TPR) repeat protein